MLSALFNAISRRVAHILISLYVRYTELMQNEVKKVTVSVGAHCWMTVCNVSS